MDGRFSWRGRRFPGISAGAHLITQTPQLYCAFAFAFIPFSFSCRHREQRVYELFVSPLSPFPLYFPFHWRELLLRTVCRALFGSMSTPPAGIADATSGVLYRFFVNEKTLTFSQRRSFSLLGVLAFRGRAARAHTAGPVCWTV